nr:hypothetical protein HmN_000090600 [Hymenolepis microstoma]
MKCLPIDMASTLPICTHQDNLDEIAEMNDQIHELYDRPEKLELIVPNISRRNRQRSISPKDPLVRLNTKTKSVTAREFVDPMPRNAREGVNIPGPKQLTLGENSTPSSDCDD